jgi:hypothetical protein
MNIGVLAASEAV